MKPAKKHKKQRMKGFVNIAAEVVKSHTLYGMVIVLPGQTYDPQVLGAQVIHVVCVAEETR